MRQILLTAAALVALTAPADAAARIPAPQTRTVTTSAVLPAGAPGHGLRPALPRDPEVAQIARPCGA
jgi:hypothetical protein